VNYNYGDADAAMLFWFLIGISHQDMDKIDDKGRHNRRP
jgi:hypothetical protein